MRNWQSLLPPAHQRALAHRMARNLSVRWSIWLGADTAPRLSAARGITTNQAWHLLRAAERDGVVVRVGTRWLGGPSPAIRYATPDPEIFP